MSHRSALAGMTATAGLLAVTLVTFAGRAVAQPDDGWIDLKGHRGSIQSLGFSPDGKRLVSVGGAGGGRSEVRVWDIAAGTSRVLIPEGAHPVAAFLRDGKSVAAGQTTRTPNGDYVYSVAVWNADSGAMGPAVPGSLELVSPTGTAVVQTKDGYAVWDLKANRQAVAFKKPDGGSTTLIAPDGKTVAVYFKNSVRLLDVPGGKERAGIEGLVGNIRTGGIAFTPDGTRLLCTTDQTHVTLWDVSDPAKRPRILADQPLPLQNGLAVSPDGAVIAARGYELTQLELVDARTLKPRAQVTASTPARFTGAGTLVAPAPEGGQLVVADAAGKTLAVVPTGDKRADLYGAVPSPDGSRLAFGLADGATIRVLKLPAPGTAVAGAGGGPTKAADLPHPALALNRALFDVTPGTATLTFSPDGKYLVGAEAGRIFTAGRYAAWDLTTGKGVASGQAAGWTFLPDGKTLYTQEFDGNRTFYEQKTDLVTGRRQATRLARVFSVTSLPFGRLALSPDQKAVAGVDQGRGGKRVVLLPAADFRNPVELGSVAPGDEGAPRRLTFSPDARLFAFVAFDKVRLFDVAEKAERPTSAQHAADFLGFVDGGQAIGTAWLGGAGRDHVRVYDLESGQMIKEIDARQGHAAAVTAAAFSPVGHTYVTCDSDGTVLMKDWENGKELARFKAHDGKIVAAAFSPDGKTLATGTEGKEAGFVRLWTLGESK